MDEHRMNITFNSSKEVASNVLMRSDSHFKILITDAAVMSFKTAKV